MPRSALYKGVKALCNHVLNQVLPPDRTLDLICQKVLYLGVFLVFFEV